MDSVMKLCSDLQQNATPFQLSVKIVGSVDFHLSTMPSEREENENNRSGSSWRQRGPAYLRRQLKRCLEKKLKRSQKSGEDDEMTRRDGGGGSSYSRTTPTKKTHVSVEKAAENFDSQQPNVTNNESEEGEVSALGGGIVKEWEEGGGGVDNVAKEKEKSDKQRRSDLVDQMKKIREEMKIQRQMLRGSMAIISEHIFPIYNEDHGSHHFYHEVEYVDSHIEKCRKEFGLPDVTAEREWLKESCDDEGIDIPQKISQKLKSCWSSDDICLNCNQRKPRFCITQIKHNCNLRYDSDLNDFVPK